MNNHYLCKGEKFNPVTRQIYKIFPAHLKDTFFWETYYLVIAGNEIQTKMEMVKLAEKKCKIMLIF